MDLQTSFYKKVDELSGRVTRLIGLSAVVGLLTGASKRTEAMFTDQPDALLPFIKYGLIFAAFPLLLLATFQLQAASVLLEEALLQAFSLGKDKDGRHLVFGPLFIVMLLIAFSFLVSLFAIFLLVQSVSVKS